MAVGEDLELVGLPNTLMKGNKTDSVNSLKALVDSKLRKKVVAANQSSHELISSHVTGEGHEFWVDGSTGFTKEEQDALIFYLLRVTDDNNKK